MTDFLDALNEPQKQAVMAVDGPVMVIAGAGSGKTRVLTYRIAHLLSLGVPPFQILALTFTNKAAREMRERIAQLVDASRAKSLWMGTFHSIFARILRSEAERLGFPRNFTIYDTNDSKRVIKAVLKVQNLDEKTYQPNYLLGRISNAKNNLISTVDYNEDREIQLQDVQMRKPKTGLIYSLYQQKLRKAGAMDFDDLLFNTNVLLRDFPDVLYTYQQRFEYILVDEYQDTNYAQYLIIKKLAANNENLCVVGDDAQSIYAFRGANIRNILNFKNDYPDFQTFKLEQNYRSTGHIVQAANSVIEHNKDQIFKKIWTGNETGERVQVVRTSNEADEAHWLASRMYELKTEKQISNRSFAVLYRTNAQSRAIEEALRRLNIPYRVFGGVSFYQRKEVKDLLAYFRLVINPLDEDAFLRAIQFPPRGVGQSTLNKLVAAAGEQGKSIWEVALHPQAHGVQLHSGLLGKLASFTDLIRRFSGELYKLNAYELGERIATLSGIRKHYFEEGTPESINRRENVEELLAGLKDFVSGNTDLAGMASDREKDPGSISKEQMRTLDEFMQDIVLLTDADVVEADKKQDPDSVSLMTVHAAKGLEFPYVFIAGAEENLFPSQLSVNSREELEEERRLFYVALTRAMKLATITHAETRFRYGQFNFCEPSRFVDELHTDSIQYLGSKPGGKASGRVFPTNKPAPAKDRQTPAISGRRLKKITGERPHPTASAARTETSSASSREFGILPPEQLHVDMRVQHQRFGNGTIIQLEGSGQHARATVMFTGFGTKQLLLKYARLKILD